MGIEIASTQFDSADRARFVERLELQLEQLSALLATPGFGAGASSIGAELELYIVNRDGHAAHCNQLLWDAAADPQLTLELNKYNLEYNLSPYALAERGLVSTEKEIVEKLRGLSAIADTHDMRLIPIGILPTLREADLGVSCVTERQRYRALLAQLIEWRGSDFQIDINGEDPLKMTLADITLEGANTSFQIHQRVNPDEFGALFNAMQLVTPLAVAIGANSPGIFGHRLWDETRIPLFKQSIDTRRVDRYRWSEPARVSYGHGWVRHGARELFEQTVRLYPPLLPVCDEAEAVAVPGVAPELAELRLHQSTVWLWNRPVYDDVDGGHLRIEMRALPAGPSAVDMVSTAALLIGLARGLRDHMEGLLPSLPFALAEHNFYRAAQRGFDARIVWPSPRQHRLRDRSVSDIIASLLPLADDGLRELGVSREERDRYLTIIDARLAARRNGAGWQRECTARHVAGGRQPADAQKLMLEQYFELSHANVPIAEWPL